MSESKGVRIFTMPQEFPCGPQSSCCGPVGQTDEEIRALKDVVEKKLGMAVEILNVKDRRLMKGYGNIASTLNSFGWGILPIVVLDDEVVSMGISSPDQVLDTLKEKIN